jgi:hypothetical protein
MKCYDELLAACRAIESAWLRCDNRCEDFAAVVLQHTEGLDLSPFGDLCHTPALLSHPYVASLQRPSTFSDLYFKLYDNGRFWVEVLNWWGSDINVHDHNFSGVQFQLRGASLNVVYRYQVQHALSNLTLGRLEVARAELWQPGARSLVRPGAAEPHNVSHLDIPTVSLLIRTHPQPALGQQNNYLAPDVSGNYGIADIIFRKKIGALRLLARGPRSEFQRTLRATLERQTHAENLFTLLKLLDIVFRPEHAGLLLDYARRGALEHRLLNAVAMHRAQDYLSNSIKHVAGLNRDEILLVCLLASSFDRDSWLAIRASLRAQGMEPDCERSHAGLRRKLHGAQRQQFDNILSLYELDRQCLAA